MMGTSSSSILDDDMENEYFRLLILICERYANNWDGGGGGDDGHGHSEIGVQCSEHSLKMAAHFTCILAKKYKNDKVNFDTVKSFENYTIMKSTWLKLRKNLFIFVAEGYEELMANDEYKSLQENLLRFSNLQMHIFDMYREYAKKPNLNIHGTCSTLPLK
nr:hypothetical protein [Microctonus hyperodae filamentous virus]